MKRLLTIALLIMLSISMISCEFRVERDARIVDQYFAETTLFQCKIVSLREPTYNDSTRFITDVYYILGKDIWDAQRLFSDKLSNLQNSLNGSEVYWEAIPISEKQSYPYTYE